MGKRLSILLFLVVTFLTIFAFTTGSGSAQTTGSATAGTGSATASPTATRAPTVAPTATRAATAAGGSAVATGTGGATVTTIPATGHPHSGAPNLIVIEAIVLALAVIGTGIALKRRAPRA
jgi:hypothetical protein